MAQKNILVPLDGSAFSEASLPVALEAARRRGDGIELMVVFEDEPSVAGWPLSPERVAASFDAYLKTVVERIGPVEGTAITTTVEGGNVMEHLVKHAGRWNTELVVMSTHGRGAVSRAWLGSVADHMVRHATVPILLVRPVEGEDVDVGATPSLDNVLVALDGSHRAERGLEYAVRVSGPDASYTLLRVVPGPILHWSTYIPAAIQETSEGLKKGRAEAEAYLAQVAERLRASGLAVTTQVVDGVPPAAGILSWAEDHPTDVIAITTHGRTGLSRLLLGSVADKVVRGSSAPVLITRAAD